MVAEPGRGYDALWEWGENGADALAWKRVEDDYNLFRVLRHRSIWMNFSEGIGRVGQRFKQKFWQWEKG